jgi:hypothetical protein
MFASDDGEIAQLVQLMGSLYAALFATQKPDVVSMSFGFAIDPGQNPDGASWISKIEPIFAAMGASGITVIAGAGDGGAVNDPETFTINTTNNQWSMPFSCTRTVFWPAASPYVTAVGATQLALCPNCHATWPPGQPVSAGGTCVQVSARHVLCETLAAIHNVHSAKYLSVDKLDGQPPSLAHVRIHSLTAHLFTRTHLHTHCHTRRLEGHHAIIVLCRDHERWRLQQHRVSAVLAERSSAGLCVIPAEPHQLSSIFRRTVSASPICLFACACAFAF